MDHLRHVTCLLWACFSWKHQLLLSLSVQERFLGWKRCVEKTAASVLMSMMYLKALFVLNSLFQSLKMLFDLFMCAPCNVPSKPERTKARWPFLSLKSGRNCNFLIHGSQDTFSPCITDTFYNLILQCFFCDQLLWSKFPFEGERKCLKTYLEDGMQKD